jgi:hypothetical protein
MSFSKIELSKIKNLTFLSELLLTSFPQKLKSKRTNTKRNKKQKQTSEQPNNTYLEKARNTKNKHKTKQQTKTSKQTSNSTDLEKARQRRC